MDFPGETDPPATWSAAGPTVASAGSATPPTAVSAGVRREESDLPDAEPARELWRWQLWPYGYDPESPALTRLSLGELAALLAREQARFRDAVNAWWHNELSLEERLEIAAGDGENAGPSSEASDARAAALPRQPSPPDVVNPLRLVSLTERVSSLATRRKIGEKALSLAKDPETKHFVLMRLIEIDKTWDWRDHPERVQRLLNDSLAMVGLAPELMATWRRKPHYRELPSLPRHPGFETAIEVLLFLDRQDEARALCIEAARQGWQGSWDWEDRVDRELLERERARRTTRAKGSRERALERRRAERAYQSAETPLDRHYALDTLIAMVYRDRDDFPGAEALAIAYCQEMIALAPTVKAILEERHREDAAGQTRHPADAGWAPYPGPFSLPTHKGFTQLAIILERERRYDEALALCAQAKEQGWAGDWDKRMQRLRQKQQRGRP